MKKIYFTICICCFAFTNAFAQTPCSISLTSLVGTDAQSICKNDPIIDITYQVSGTGATVSPLPSGVTGSFSIGVFTISGTPTVSGTFNYSITTTGGCSPDSTITGSITSGLGLVTAGTNNQSICKNTAITPIEYNVTGGGTNYVSGLPNGVTGAMTSPSIYTISGTPIIEGTFGYTITTTGSCTSQSVASGTLTVGLGLVTAGTDTQYVCKNTPITNILYNLVGGDVPAPTITGLPPGVTGAITSPGVFTISGTLAAEGIYNYTLNTSGSCASQSSLTGIITVGGGLDVSGGSNIQNVCKGSSITAIKYNILGAGGATVSGLPGGITGSTTTAGSPGVFTISGIPTTTGSFSYTITTYGTCLTQSSFIGTITVTSPDDASFSYSSSTFCKTGVNPTPIITGAAGGAFTFTPAGLVINSTTGTINLASSSVGNYNITYTTSGSCPNSSTFNLHIVNVPQAIFDYADPFCQNSPNSLPVFMIGSSPGIFSSSSGLNFINTATGEIDLATSSPGTYTIVNTISCAGTLTTATTVVKINLPAVTILSTNESSLNACDGYLEAVSNGIPPVTYAWNNFGSIVSTPIRNNMCSGNYSVTVTDSAGCSAIAYAHVGSNSATPITNINPISLSAYPMDVSDAALCDGGAYVMVTGGLSPYTINFAGFTISNDSVYITNLCAGFYTVNATDANSDSASYTFVISSPPTTFPFTNTFYVDSTVVDTLFTNAFPNCTIDYDSIDSVQITNFNFISMDSINVTWTIYNGTTTSNQSANYEFSLPGVYTLVLDLFCTNRTSGVAKGIDQLYLNFASLGIETLETANIFIYPNPFNDQLYILTDKYSSIKITDVIGSLIYNGSINAGGNTINMGNYNSGVYFITITNGQNAVTKKIIKN